MDSSRYWAHNMLMGFLKEAEKWNFSEALVSLKLIGNFGKTLEGRGKITWDESGVSIEAQTNGASEIHDSMFGLQQSIGEIYPRDFYFRLEGKTLSGQTVTIGRVMPSKYTINSKSEFVDWNLGNDDILDLVKVTDKIEHEKLSGTTAFLLSPEEIDSYPRLSETTHGNPVFGSKSTKRNWLQIQCKLGLISAQKREAGTIHCKIEHESQIKLEELVAIQTAISFLTGRQVGFRAVEVHWGNETHRYFGWRSPKRSANRMSPPIGLGITSVQLYETFLSKLTDYFLTPRGVEVASLIYACQDSKDNSFTTHAMVACAALEGMLKPYTKELVVCSGLSADDKSKVEAFCNESEFPEKVVRRLAGFMNAMESPSVDQVLRNWIEDDFLEVSAADLKAWKSLRNPVMHGKRVLVKTTPKKNQNRVNEIGRVTNLINKITLFEAGYFGRYYDCSIHQQRVLHDPREVERREHWIAESAYFKWINSASEHGKDLENWGDAVVDFERRATVDLTRVNDYVVKETSKE